MKAIGFDLGGTLINYKGIPMSWQTLYGRALTDVAVRCNCKVNDKLLFDGEQILSKYNTRPNPRTIEVTADKILGEILTCWNVPIDTHLKNAEDTFFSYFRKEFKLYDDTISILKYLKSKDIKIGILTDVPYGMGYEFVKKDIASISEYIDVVLSSVEVGFRKPEIKGYIDLVKCLHSNLDEMVFVGDEEKDILGANRIGMFSVFIDRNGSCKKYGENKRVSSLMELKEVL
ncbi:MAG TPA: HAD family hydrolase [Clostridium sp.]|uniref:HAD family hydrolase n=1 Tax=Clostridium sp. TaxID=1506 RepID=UPI002F94D594